MQTSMMKRLGLVVMVVFALVAVIDTTLFATDDPQYNCVGARRDEAGQPAEIPSDVWDSAVPGTCSGDKLESGTCRADLKTFITLTHWSWRYVDSQPVRTNIGTKEMEIGQCKVE